MPTQASLPHRLSRSSVSKWTVAVSKSLFACTTRLPSTVAMMRCAVPRHWYTFPPMIWTNGTSLQDSQRVGYPDSGLPDTLELNSQSHRLFRVFPAFPHPHQLHSGTLPPPTALSASQSQFMQASASKAVQGCLSRGALAPGSGARKPFVSPVPYVFKGK